MTVVTFPAPVDPQIQAADPRATVFVTANAGSGKTKTLVDRVARLLLGGVRPDAVLCVTYTKAAAAEMQTRLFDQLGGWAVLEDEALRAALGRLDASDPARFGPDDLARARRLFAQALETPGGLKIQTIHAFCEKLLRRFPIEAGVSPRFVVLEDSAQRDLSARARQHLAEAALAAPDGPVGLAYSHFAVELDWGRFESLLATLETRRTELAQYMADIEGGVAPSLYDVCGLPEGTTPEVVEAEAVAAIDWRAWDDARAALQAGSVTDQKIAAAMGAVDRGKPVFDVALAVFCTKGGEARASMATKAVPATVKSRLTAEQHRLCAARDRL
ncbi:MAG TPA: UvrD-helicase domain-containing protein, partial [Caulobacteraceae bacterium]